MGEHAEDVYELLELAMEKEWLLWIGMKKKT
jgi:hypothetical protein